MICTAHFGGFFLHSVRDRQLDAGKNPPMAEKKRRNRHSDARFAEQSLELVTVSIDASKSCKVICLFNKAANKFITIGASKESSDLIL
jgi:hypothetical protein